MPPHDPPLALAEVNREIRRVGALPPGPARTARAEQLVRRVEAEGPDGARAYALLTLIESYDRGGELERMFVPFARLLRWSDEHPEHLDRHDREALLHAFKQASHLKEFPTVSAEQIDRTAADLERRCSLAGGRGLHWAAYDRFAWADQRGAPEAEAAYLAWVTAPHDDLSGCAACEPGVRAEWLLATDRVAEAGQLLEHALARNPMCNAQPADMLHLLAEVYLDTGRPAEAARTYRRAVAAFPRATAAMIDTRGQRVRLLARGGQVDAALRSVAGDQRLLTVGPTPFQRLGFLRHVGAATHVLRAEHGDRPVDLAAVPAGTVAELDDWLRAQADALAAQFDARNGTTAQRDRVARAWRTEPTPVRLDLAVLPPRAGRPTATPPAPAPDRAGPPGGSTPAVLLADAERLLAARDLESAADAYLGAAVAFEAEGLLRDSGFGYAEAAHCAQVLGDDDGAASGYAEAVARLRAADVPVPVVVPVLVAWARSAAAAGQAEVVLVETDRLQTRLTEVGRPSRDGDRAPDLVAREQATDHRAAADLDDTAARLLATLGGPERCASAAVRAQAAAETYAALGAVPDAAHASWLAGRLHDGLGHVEDAVRHLESAMAGFAAARQHGPYGEVANDLVAVLHRSGQVTRAEELVRTLAS